MRLYRHFTAILRINRMLSQGSLAVHQNGDIPESLFTERQMPELGYSKL